MIKQLKMGSYRSDHQNHEDHKTMKIRYRFESNTLRMDMSTRVFSSPVSETNFVFWRKLGSVKGFSLRIGLKLVNFSERLGLSQPMTEASLVAAINRFEFLQREILLTILSWASRVWSSWNFPISCLGISWGRWSPFCGLPPLDGDCTVQIWHPTSISWQYRPSLRW